MNAIVAVSGRAWLALLLVSMLAMPAGAVSSGNPGDVGEGETEAVTEQDPTIEDIDPTMELTEPVAETSADPVAATVKTGSDGAIGCAVEVELPEEGTPAPTADASEEPECIELIDAVPTEMTPDGPVPMNSPDGESDTEALLLERLRERREQLEVEARDLDQRAALLEAAEQQIEIRASELAEVETRIGDLVDEQRELSSAQVDELAALYLAMRPKDAAAVLQGLPDEVMLQIAAAIPSRKMAAIMSEMDLAAAQSLTVMMMRKPVTQP